jgi:cation diffusion facilitator CzcD-associated flavoprotein CzcO
MTPDVAVVGAGPFGFSVAASLPRRARVYGAPMETWRTRMPPDMLLRSAWEETSLRAAGDRGTIDEWASEAGLPRAEPLPLQTFLSYADWFRERYVEDHDPSPVAAIESRSGGWRVTSASGDVLDVTAVVVAVGVIPFGHVASPFERGERVQHVTDDPDLSAFEGKRVAIVGAGQAGLETAGLAARAGADVELLVRSSVHWFADREPHHPRGRAGRIAYRLAYPAVGYGPPILNRGVLAPDLYAALPGRTQRFLSRAALRPGGSAWVRSMVEEGDVRISEGVVVVEAREHDRVLDLRLSDGTAREVDHVLLATGYRFSLGSLPFEGDVPTAVSVDEGGWPKIDRGFRAAPGLYFAGYAAEGRYGPLARFVLGAPFTARRIAASLA